MIEYEEERFQIRNERGIRTFEMLAGPWQEEYDRLMVEHNLNGLSLSHRVEDPFAVLERYPRLRSIGVWVGLSRELERLASFVELENLAVQGVRGREIRGAIRLPRLRRLAADFHPALLSVLDNPSLEWVSLGHPPGPDLTGWPELPQLQTLTLGSGRKLLSLDGVERFPALEHLDVSYQPALGDFSALGRARSLTSIEIDGCRGLRDLEWVKLLPGLRSLKVHNCGDIESVAALRGHPGLETLILSESTKILDGDTTPILEIPSLQSIGLRAYRHCEPPAEQIEDAVYSRPGNTRPHQGDVIVHIFEEL